MIRRRPAKRLERCAVALVAVLGLAPLPGRAADDAASTPAPPAARAPDERAPTPRPGAGCRERADDGCYFGFDLPDGAGRMHYYASRAPRDPAAGAPGTSADDTTAPPQSVLLVMHGHPRDANRSFDAALKATRAAGRLGDTLVVAPVFQVPAGDARRCRAPGVPAAAQGDAVWTCASWLEGGASAGPHPIGAFAALDALVAELHRQWPSLKTATLAGFSAGAQMLQHRIGFAADPPAGLRVRHVIADPGSWLYFDPVRPQPLRNGQPVDWAACGSGGAFPGGCDFRLASPPGIAACPGYDHWKYGTTGLPAALGRGAADARARYAAADIHYLEGADDSSNARGAYARVLDKSCAAMLQGPFRLQRGVAYAAYDRALLSPGRPRMLTIVPGCAHDVACVLPSDAARAALFGP